MGGNMKKFLFLGFLFVVLAVTISCGSKAKIDTPENLAATVVEAVLLNNQELFKKCLLDEKDLDYLYPLMKMPPDREAKFREELKTEYLPEMILSLEEVRAAALKDGVDNLNYEIVNLDYKIKTKDGYEKTNIFVTIKSNNVEYKMILEDCIKGPKGWKLGDNMRWKGKK